MKPNLFSLGRRQRGGFSLVEAAFSIGVLGFSVLTLAPMLALGLKTSRTARTERETAQIAQTLIQQAEQGTTVAATTYLNDQGAACSPAQAAFTAQATSGPVAEDPALTRLTLHLTPIGSPDRARTYAVVYQAPH